MKLQTTCASDKAAHIKVSVKEKVSREMSISAQREESLELEGGKVREKNVDRKEREKTESIRERSCTPNMRGWGGGDKEKRMNELSMKERLQPQT